MARSTQQDIEYILQEGIFLHKIVEDSKIVDCYVVIILYIKGRCQPVIFGTCPNNLGLKRSK